MGNLLTPIVSEKSISIIIRSFNEEKHVGRLLVGIMEQSIKDVEIILVDSGSTDATVSIASQFPTKVVHINPGEFSFGRALNRGCEVATGEFLVNASAHVYPVNHNWLENMIMPFGDPKVALVYGKQRGADTTKYSEHQIFKQWFPNSSVSAQQHPFCNNANLAIRRSLWVDQPWDEELTGLEDMDWAKKILTQGYYLAYSAESPIIHVHDETLKGILNRYRREAIAHKIIVPEQRFSLLDFFYLSISNIITDYYHAKRDGVLWRNRGDILKFRILQHWGAYRGFKDSDQTSLRLKESFYYPRGFSRDNEAEGLMQNDGAISYEKTLHEYLDE